MENLVARRLRTVLANEIEDGMEHILSHQLSEDRPLDLSPREGSPTMDELCRPIHRSIVEAIPVVERRYGVFKLMPKAGPGGLGTAEPIPVECVPSPEEYRLPQKRGDWQPYGPWLHPSEVG